MKTRVFAIGIALMAVMTVCAGSASALYIDPYLERQEAAHAVAETARAYGYAEDSAVIQAAQADWWQAQAELDAEIDMLARVVWFEAGSNWISDRQQQLVAQVVLNRCADSRFPSTIKGVVYAKGQYSCASRLYSIGKANIPARCYENAKLAVYGQVDCPANVVWQAGFKQGKGVYAYMGNTYFCWS